MSGPSFNDNNTQQQQQQKNLNSMKKNLTLDFNQSKLNLNNTFTSDLNMIKVDTPELNLLKVDTPTIENIILANGLPNTPSPSILFPRTVTAEQETFAGGFVEALNNLHNNGNSQNSSDTNSSVFSTNNNSNTNGNTSNNNSTTNEPTSFLPVIKEEPQTVPNINNNTNNNNSSNNVNTPPMSPVDMEYQERMKLERKRQRNRLAASKCRSRKLERISKLEDKVKLLKSENAELSSVINQLKEHVGLLKLEVMEHANAGCPIMGATY